jgi:predicted O-methyltransferase YrrM
MREQAAAILEIGSLEGRSAIFWLEYLPRAAVTCVDTFQGTTKFHDDVEGRFDRNTAAYGPRIRKIKSRSDYALVKLSAEQTRFDMIYIDGSHLRDDVMVDCLLAWPMLRSGGLMMLDDYELDLHKRSADHPRAAIDTFLAWHEEEIDELHRGYQVVIRRRV